MADKVWKQRERQVCSYFGTTRKPVPGRQRDKDGDDGEHPVLHIQQKHSKSHRVLKVWDAANAVALKEDKVPIVTLTSPGRPGFWILCKAEDLEAVAHQRDIASQQGLKNAFLRAAGDQS